MEQEKETVLEEIRRRRNDLVAEAGRDGIAVKNVRTPSKEQMLQMHYANVRVDIDTKGTFREEDAALLANLKRYRAASVNIQEAEDRSLYGRLLDAASEFYAQYAGLYEEEKQIKAFAGNEEEYPASFLTREKALLSDVIREEKMARNHVQLIERFFRLTASRKMETDEETFAFRLQSEDDFPESFRDALGEAGIKWDAAVRMGEKLHNDPPVLAKALFVVDGYSEEQAEPFLTQNGSDDTFKTEDPYAVLFAVSNFDNALQPLFSSAQVKALREQKKSMYDMIFVDGITAKELYGPKISRNQDAKQRGNEMKMRIFADLMQGKCMEISNGEKVLSLILRVEMDGLKDKIEERELAAEWSEDKVREKINEESSRLTEWIGQLQEKMWGVVEDAVKEHPDGIEDEKKIRKWLDGLMEIDE